MSVSYQQVVRNNAVTHKSNAAFAFLKTGEFITLNDGRGFLHFPDTIFFIIFLISKQINIF